MRFIRTVLLLAVMTVAGVFAYNYWSGNGWTLRPPTNSSGVNVETARRRSADLVTTATEKGREAATTIEGALSEGAMTTKIKSRGEEALAQRWLSADSNLRPPA